MRSTVGKPSNSLRRSNGVDDNSLKIRIPTTSKSCKPARNKFTTGVGRVAKQSLAATVAGLALIVSSVSSWAAEQPAQFQVPGYPAYYLLDSQNRVVARSFGYSTQAGLKIMDLIHRG